jgi:hypothetical protein
MIAKRAKSSRSNSVQQCELVNLRFEACLLLTNSEGELWLTCTTTVTEDVATVRKKGRRWWRKSRWNSSCVINQEPLEACNFELKRERSLHFHGTHRLTVSSVVWLSRTLTTLASPNSLCSALQWPQWLLHPRLLQSYLQAEGRAIAEAVSRRIPTAAALVRALVMTCGICGKQSGTEAGFLRVLRFSVPALIPPTAPHSSSIVRGWYNRPISCRRTKWTQSHPTPRN